MKIFFALLSLIFISQAWAASCKPGQIRVWKEDTGYSCVQRFQTATTDIETDCVTCDGCQDKKETFDSWLAKFPTAVYQPEVNEWWVAQGNFHYPNLHYPGAWNNKGKNPGINAKLYPGDGEVHALKPNIYVESIHQEKKFTYTFTSKTALSFLATTPPLDEKNSWQGKIKNKDTFEVEDVPYDYLFYDIRLPKEKMQFEHGLCATREETIKWMLKDLTEMSYPSIALQDFEEHWKVKIPDYPYYCIYPQYNKQLDDALPVAISLEQSKLIRSLYVLIPHRKEPDVQESQMIPLPVLDSSEIRPNTLIRYENMFKEWGVAFLGE